MKSQISQQLLLIVVSLFSVVMLALDIRPADWHIEVNPSKRL